MNTDNKSILLQANECIMRGDHEGFLSYCTEDTRWEFVGDQTLQGKQAVRDYMKTAYQEAPHFDVEKLIADEDHVTAIGRISMKNTDGQLIHYSYCDVWQLKDGKLDKLQAFVIETGSR